MIGIHQSQFLPWVPYFLKILQSDVFIILDDVQYQKNGVQNRNLIKTPQGSQWLTIPVCRDLDTLIKDVRLTDPGCLKKIKKTLEMNYKKSEFFDDVFGAFDDIWEREFECLHELNFVFLKRIVDLLNIKTKIILSSELKISLKKDDLVIEIIQALGQKEYLSGKGALSYMDIKKFEQEGIKIFLSHFNYAEYPQLWMNQQGFLLDLSIMDLLFNNLTQAQAYIFNNGKMIAAVDGNKGCKRE